MAKNAITMGNIARFSMVDGRLLHNLEADKISDAASRAIRHTTAMMLVSGTPAIEKRLPTDVVLKVLKVLVVLMVLKVLVVLIVDIMDDNIFPSSSCTLFLFLASVCLPSTYI